MDFLQQSQSIDILSTHAIHAYVKPCDTVYFPFGYAFFTLSLSENAFFVYQPLVADAVVTASAQAPLTLALTWLKSHAKSRPNEKTVQDHYSRYMSWLEKAGQAMLST